MKQIELFQEKVRFFFLCYNTGRSGSFYNTIQNKRGSILKAWINLMTIEGKTFIRQISKRINALDIKSTAKRKRTAVRYRFISTSFILIPITKWFYEFQGMRLPEILIFRLNKTRGLAMLSRGFCD